MPTEARERGAHQLPSGKSGLPRDRVVAHQRNRILDATVSGCEEVGVANLTVADIIAAAGVSRRTFYELFASRDEAVVVAVAEGRMPSLLDIRQVLGSDTVGLMWPSPSGVRGGDHE